MNPCLKLSNKGFAVIPIIIALTILATGGGIIAYSQLKTNSSNPNSTTISSSLPSPTPEVSLTPTPTASPSATPKPSLTPKPSTTPKPAVQTPVNNTPPSSGYGFLKVGTDRGTFSVHVVTVDTATGAKMVTDTASDNDCPKDCPTLSLADFVSRNGGFAGINGSYFCPAAYPDCVDKKDSFDFSVYNSRLGKWINQGQLSWNSRSIVYMDGGGMHYMQNANGFGGGLNAGIVNYPGILNNGQITVEAPSLSDKQSAKGTKGGIGINGSKVYLVIASGVDMYDFASVFKAIGATHALNLDGGGSAALWFGGYTVGPGRALPNAIIFK